MVTIVLLKLKALVVFLIAVQRQRLTNRLTKLANTMSAIKKERKAQTAQSFDEEEDVINANVDHIKAVYINKRTKINAKASKGLDKANNKSFKAVTELEWLS